jgi:catechol 2,3-dioxygenase-like lactoylglutathione lyase family enzyme
MLHHIEIYVSNLNVSHAFWSKILQQIGYEQAGRWDDGFTLRKGNDPYITFVQVAETFASRKYHRKNVGLNHLAFKVKGRKLVDSLRQFCLSNDIPLLYDDKYPYANGGNTYYALYVEDPDRIKIEFVAV